MLFKSKADTLIFLKKKIKNFKIPQILSFREIDWKKNKKFYLEKIYSTFKKKNIVIRSSALDEDTQSSSSAGKYRSFLDVSLKNKSDVIKKINDVFKSYNKGKKNYSNKILIQEMISNIKMSGVVFNKDISSGYPYYIINYDDISGLTDTVTSGSGKYANKSLYVFKNKIDFIKTKRFKKLLHCVKELEKISGNLSLDIEFAINKKNIFYLFQVRPLIIKNDIKKKGYNRLNKYLELIFKELKTKFKKEKNLFGKQTLLGQMPDWNPAEMIGQHPSYLASSMYKELITNETWLNSRVDMGYRSFDSKALMSIHAGKPYIDIRKSLNSFLPNTISEKISNKIINNSINKIMVNPTLHDKLEFDVTTTCFNFDFEKRVKSLIPNINKKESKCLKLSYLEIFKKNLVSENKGSLQFNLKKIKKLEKIQKEEIKDGITDLENLKSIIENCKNFGIKPFAIIARHAFASKEIINSFLRLNIFSKKRVANFYKSIQTITFSFLEDQNKIKNNNKKLKIFLKKYGHLRPGTYDINSLRYDQSYKNIFSNTSNKKINKNKKQTSFYLNNKEKKKIDNLLKTNSINLSVNDLFKYFKKSIAAREYAKFIFSRSISLSLEKIKYFAKKRNIPLNLVENLELMDFFKIRKINFKQIKIKSNHREKIHKINNNIKLPEIVVRPEDIFIGASQVHMPNFVSDKVINGEIFYLNKEKLSPKINLKNKIILIENADPGYDWLFSHKIRGLVTKYGGANSHMTIRCSELGLPAAIGCGEQMYKKLIEFYKIEINCLTKNIKIIS
tara:strand:- start:18 stop:2381 length:2364 start_codon:yes stop_codon:yes gene_type:complete